MLTLKQRPAQTAPSEIAACGIAGMALRLLAPSLESVFDEDARAAALLAVPVRKVLADFLRFLSLRALDVGVDEFCRAGVLSHLYARFLPRLLRILEARKHLHLRYRGRPRHHRAHSRAP